MDNYRKKSKKSAHIGSILNDVLKTLRPEADGGLVQVWKLWDDVVGRAIAESSPWIHQLQFLKKEIIEKLNAALGQDLIEDVKFKIGPV
jgi:predicted nucleic acid-binding Zn ribbon protein